MILVEQLVLGTGMGVRWYGVPGTLLYGFEHIPNMMPLFVLRTSCHPWYQVRTTPQAVSICLLPTAVVQRVDPKHQ